MSGPTNATTTADASGNFSFAGITNGSYTLTPAKAGLVFMPTSLTASVAGASVTGANFSVPQNCPCNTIWQPSATPAIVTISDSESVELGVKFRSDVSGYVTGVRFYKGAENTGIHQGNLWSSTGSLLANVVFNNEGSSGWQQAFFSTPVAIDANTTYVVSYLAPVGKYSADSGYFANAGTDAAPLHALANGIDGSNGAYFYGPNGGFPVNSTGGANYWVDVIFTQTYSISGSITGAGGVGATVTLNGPVTATTTVDASGNYSFPAIVNGTYTVTPSKDGYAFNPVNRRVTVNGGNVVVDAFTVAASTYSVTGTISGAGGNGATVSLSGPSTATTTADASGNYSFAAIANGTYTVTPSKQGYTFNPINQSVVVNGANAVVAVFIAAPQTFSITGTISGTGGNGATVTLGGAKTATVTANAAGVYTFSALVNGSYTVTPTKTGFVFTPSMQAVSLNGANATVNFTAVQVYTLSGTISGAGGNGTTVTLSGSSSGTVTASSSGVYSFSVVNGSYTVTPSKAGYVFTPASQAVTVSGANKTANFSSAVQTYTLSGTISGAGGSGATVKLAGAKTATVTANSSGVYTFTGLANGSYTVTPTKAGFTYAPASQTVTVNGTNTSANFTSAAQTYSISGKVSNGGGATIKLTGAATVTVTADSSGAFTFSGLLAGSYTVTPSRPGHLMIPGSRSVKITTANVTGVTFFSL
jgi:hypothetical protein